PAMLHAKLVCSPHPSARIVAINVDDALTLPGVRAVVTGQDTPCAGGFQIKDRWPFAQDRVRYVGEPVAGVAADSLEIAVEAARRIRVEYEPLPAVFDPEQAARPTEVLVHPEVESYQ